MSTRGNVAALKRRETMENTRPDSVHGAKLVEVIEVLAVRGEGTEADVCRQVARYYSKAGALLAERDEWGDEDLRARLAKAEELAESRNRLLLVVYSERDRARDERIEAERVIDARDLAIATAQQQNELVRDELRRVRARLRKALRSR